MTTDTKLVIFVVPRKYRRNQAFSNINQNGHDLQADIMELVTELETGDMCLASNLCKTGGMYVLLARLAGLLVGDSLGVSMSSSVNSWTTNTGSWIRKC